MRTQIRLQQLDSGNLWRVCEADGLPVSRWLPTEPFLGCLDRGGFETYGDARGFGLGVDLVRSEAGLCDPNVRRSILRERDAQDEGKQGRPRADQRPVVLAFEAA